MEFEPFPKIARLHRGCTITEKIDGTNAQIFIRPTDEGPLEFGIDTQIEIATIPAFIRAGSRNRYLTHGGKTDNYGFGMWVHENAHELTGLGFGRHYGEWWGLGIQRVYGQVQKRFSLFNSNRWQDRRAPRPACCDVVPLLYEGAFDDQAVRWVMNQLQEHGSAAASGFMNPEGIVVYHHASKTYYKKTLKDDAEPKSLAA